MVARAGVLIAALTAAAAITACGADGDDPGGPRRATLVLDFAPNAVHAGIYSALAHGEYEERGVALDVRVPGASTDAPKLLEAGRAELAILDIHDLGIAREGGFELVGIAPIVGRPLAAVIAGDRSAVRRPCDLEGATVGVTGLPSDDAVLDSVVAADGCDPGAVDRVTIGFNAVSSLAAGKVDAATSFWNAEGVALERLGIPIRSFRVDEYGAPRYPELILCASSRLVDEDPGLVRAVVAATSRGYELAEARPSSALEDLLDGASGLDRDEQRAQLDALLSARAFAPGRLERDSLAAWARWDARHGILERRPEVSATFELALE